MKKIIVIALLSAGLAWCQQEDTRRPGRPVIVPEMPKGKDTVTYHITLLKSDVDAIWEVVKDIKEVVPGTNPGELIQRNAYKSMGEAFQKLVSAWVTALKDRAPIESVQSAQTEIIRRQAELEAAKRTPVTVSEP